MSLPDSIEVRKALSKRLQSDSQLKSLMPDGVYHKEAPGKERFVVFSQVIENDVPEFGKRAYEDYRFMVKAVCLGSTGADIVRAAKRIDNLLEDQTLDVVGYELMTMHREERIDDLEVDEKDTSIRWQHQGGIYRVQVAIQT